MKTATTTDNPFLDVWLDAQKTALDETFALWRRAWNWGKLPQVAQRVAVAATPHDVVYEEDTLKLLRYCEDRTIAEPIVICSALTNRPYLLDLQPARSVIRQWLKRGFEAYLIEWNAPTAADRTLKLHDYVCGFLKNAIGFVRQHAGAPKVNLLGYCMGGTLSAMYASLYPEEIRNLILMAAPIDFGRGGGLLNVWADEKYFDVDGLVDAYGNCPAALLQTCFQMIQPVQNYWEKYAAFFENLHNDQYVENFLALEQGARDTLPVAGETFREFVKMLVQRNLLVKGQMRLHGASLELARIACPLLLLTAEDDRLVPPSSTLALREHVASKDIKAMSFPGGHAGLAVGAKAHRQLWPQAAMWIADRSNERR